GEGRREPPLRNGPTGDGTRSVEAHPRGGSANEASGFPEREDAHSSENTKAASGSDGVVHHRARDLESRRRSAGSEKTKDRRIESRTSGSVRPSRERKHESSVGLRRPGTPSVC